MNAFLKKVGLNASQIAGWTNWAVFSIVAGCGIVAALIALGLLAIRLSR